MFPNSFILTPPAHCVFAARHNIFALLVFPRNHFKLDGCVTHAMVSFKALMEDLIWRQQPSLACQLVDSRILNTDVVKILQFLTVFRLLLRGLFNKVRDENFQCSSS